MRSLTKNRILFHFPTIPLLALFNHEDTKKIVNDEDSSSREYRMHCLMVLSEPMKRVTVTQTLMISLDRVYSPHLFSGKPWEANISGESSKKAENGPFAQGRNCIYSLHYLSPAEKRWDANCCNYPSTIQTIHYAGITQLLHKIHCQYSWNHSLQTCRFCLCERICTHGISK